MGLYDSRKKVNLKLPEVRFDFDWKRYKVPALGLAALLVVLFFVFSIALMVQPKTLESRLEPNPLDLASEQNSFLTVTVKNLSGKVASNVVVSVEADAPDAIDVFPSSRVIPTLDDRRELTPFVVRPKPGSTVYSGTYILNIRTSVNGQDFEQQVALELKAA